MHFLLKGHDKLRKKLEVKLLILFFQLLCEILSIALIVPISIQRCLVELICSFFVASWTGVVKYHGPRPSMRPNQVFYNVLLLAVG